MAFAHLEQPRKQLPPLLTDDVSGFRYLTLSWWVQATVGYKINEIGIVMAVKWALWNKFTPYPLSSKDQAIQSQTSLGLKLTL